jgi:type IV secretion system protein VirB3
MSLEGLDVSPIFLGLTRPLTLMGVTMEYVMVCGMIALSAFILSNSIAWILLYLPLHVMGWVGCKIDQHIFSVINKRCDVMVNPNRAIWGCNAYEAF